MSQFITSIRIQNRAGYAHCEPIRLGIPLKKGLLTSDTVFFLICSNRERLVSQEQKFLSINHFFFSCYSLIVVKVILDLSFRGFAKIFSFQMIIKFLKHYIECPIIFNSASCDCTVLRKSIV